MARIRTIKPDFWTDEKLTECSMGARLLFIGMLSFADDNGNLVSSVRKLKMQVFPGDDVDVASLLDELIAQGVVIEYWVEGEGYLNIKGFKKHQVINRPSKTSIPVMPDGPTKAHAPITDGSTSTHGALTEHSRSTHGALTDGREGKGKEMEVTTPNPSLPEGNESTTEKPKPTRKPAIQLKTFVENCIQAGEPPISGYKPLLKYMKGCGLPIEFIQLAWMVFKAEHMPPGPKAARRQSDWRRHFLNYIEKGFYRLWYAKQDGTFELSTAGRQAQAFHGQREVA